MRRALAALVVALVAAAAGGCGAGSSVRGYLDDTYTEQSESGDTVVYQATAPVPATTQQITAAVAPVERASDAGAEYLRYDDDIVVVAPAGAATAVRVEDIDGPYRDGAYAYLGPGFDPGSPAGAIDDSDDVK